MPLYPRHWIPVALVLALLVACGGDDDDGDGGGDGTGQNGGPTTMNPPVPPSTGLCVCPGFFGRPFDSCPKPPFDGDIAINFVCPSTSAVFNGNCKFTVSTSNPLALLLRPVDVFVPPTAPGRTFEAVFNTQANDPPGGNVAVSITDQATLQTFQLGNVLVANSCP